jgi:choline dehydrogenase
LAVRDRDSLSVGYRRIVSGFDVLILGGGPAGCALAARLSEDSACRVGVVEAGPDYGPRTSGGWPAELLDATAIPDTHDWRDSEGSLPWARVIGGCSAINACAITQAAPAEYDAWREFGGQTWT